MTQVLTNILDNALRHTPEAGRIALAAREVENMVELSVHDTGPGLSIEDIDRIFERFYRADASRQREDGGSGWDWPSPNPSSRHTGGHYQLSRRRARVEGDHPPAEEKRSVNLYNFHIIFTLLLYAGLLQLR
jgi:hypothetical protein